MGLHCYYGIYTTDKAISGLQGSYQFINCDILSIINTVGETSSAFYIHEKVMGLRATFL